MTAILKGMLAAAVTPTAAASAQSSDAD